MRSLFVSIALAVAFLIGGCAQTGPVERMPIFFAVKSLPQFDKDAQTNGVSADAMKKELYNAAASRFAHPEGKFDLVQDEKAARHSVSLTLLYIQKKAGGGCSVAFKMSDWGGSHGFRESPRTEVPCLEERATKEGMNILARALSSKTADYLNEKSSSLR